MTKDHTTVSAIVSVKTGRENQLPKSGTLRTHNPSCRFFCGIFAHAPPQVIGSNVNFMVRFCCRGSCVDVFKMNVITFFSVKHMDASKFQMKNDSELKSYSCKEVICIVL